MISFSIKWQNFFNPYCLLFTAILVIFSTSFQLAYAVLPKGHGAWVYDAIYDEEGNQTGFQPGLFANNIHYFNTIAEANHRLITLFTYGGELKMFCKGSGGSSADTPCTAQTFQISYDTGIQSTAAYFDAANRTQQAINIFPVVDGEIGSFNLKTFNQMTEDEANLFADQVALLFCADNKAAGVQFNLKDLDINQPGAYSFFIQIAKNFAGQHSADNPDPFHCINKDHQQGRFFSIFGSTQIVNAKMASLLNKYQNGYFIVSLFNLHATTETSATPPSKYYYYAGMILADIINKAKLLNIKYQLAIPAAATLHEFENANGNPSGYHQLDYVKAAIIAINDSRIRLDKNFIGIDLREFKHRSINHGSHLQPSFPQEILLTYLATEL